MNESVSSSVTICNKASIDPYLTALDDTLKQFCETEHITDKKLSYTPDELQCEKHFSKTTTLINGRFCVSLPW